MKRYSIILSLQLKQIAKSTFCFCYLFFEEKRSFSFFKSIDEKKVKENREKYRRNIKSFQKF